MNTLDCINERMSIRSFTNRNVEDEKLNTIANAALQAPTAMNSRDMVITVVHGERLKRISAAMEELMDEDMRSHFANKDGKFDFHRGGNALIVVSFGSKSVLPEQNTGCAMENMYLAATELGLGACWINQFYSFRSEKISDLLQLEDGYKPYAALSVGYIDQKPNKKERDGKIVFLK